MEQAFARSKAIFAMIAAAMGDVSKLVSVPEYRSRGKGLGKHSGKKWGPSPSWCDMVKGDDGLYRQKENGAREVARRLAQMARKSARIDAAVRKANPGFRTYPSQRALLNVLGASA